VFKLEFVVGVLAVFNDKLEQEVERRTSDLRQEIQRRQLLANELRAALDKLCASVALSYNIVDRTIVISPPRQKTAPASDRRWL
jgi:anti-sigma-K factor RskA